MDADHTTLEVIPDISTMPSYPCDGRVYRPACAVCILRAAGQEFPGLFSDLMLKDSGVDLRVLELGS